MTPWWDGKREPSLGSNNGLVELDDWARTGLALDALNNRKVLYQNGRSGSSKKEMKDVLAEFTALGGRIAYHRPAWNGEGQASVDIVWDDAVVVLWTGDGDMGGRIVTTNLDLFNATEKILDTAIGPKTSAGRIYVLMHSKDGAKLKSIGFAAMELERDNYNPSVLEDFDAVVADLKSKEPSGRLALFDGNPGTGKTHLMKGLLAAVGEALFVMVPVSLVPELASPSMIGALLDIRKDKGSLPTVFLIEDADEALANRRDGGNVNAVSALLNLSDGIIGAMLDIRVVCSTNLKNEELDEAVKREGRLSRKVHVGPLEKPVAQNLFRKLSGRPDAKVDEKLTLAQVYSLAKDNGWKPVPKKKAIGFSADPEDDFDVVDILGEDE